MEAKVKVSHLVIHFKYLKNYQGLPAELSLRNISQNKDLVTCWSLFARCPEAPYSHKFSAFLEGDFHALLYNSFQFQWLFQSHALGADASYLKKNYNYLPQANFVCVCNGRLQYLLCNYNCHCLFLSVNQTRHTQVTMYNNLDSDADSTLGICDSGSEAKWRVNYETILKPS